MELIKINDKTFEPYVSAEELNLGIANDALRRSSNKIGSVLIESMTVAGE